MIWYSKYLQVYEKPFAEAPASAIEEVRQNIAKLQSDEPLVTVSIIGYNEEKHLLACLWSLSDGFETIPCNAGIKDLTFF